MIPGLASLLFAVVVLYLVAGFIFSLCFSFRWAGRLDEQARNAPWSFRLLIIPASCLLWPYLLFRLIKSKIL